MTVCPAANTGAWQAALALAASPTFALMAWTAAYHAPPIALCSSGSFGGMTAMYGLMSVFHLSPWLKLASGRP
jgi:hypothetical protein